MKQRPVWVLKWRVDGQYLHVDEPGDYLGSRRLVWDYGVKGSVEYETFKQARKTRKKHWPYHIKHVAIMRIGPKVEANV